MEKVEAKVRKRNGSGWDSIDYATGKGEGWPKNIT